MRVECGSILTIMLKLKVCGLKNVEQAEQISALGVDFLGLIFAESPRKVGEDLAKKIATVIHKNHKKAVGVFVDEDLKQILSLAGAVGLDGVQIHRKLLLEEFETLKTAGLFVWQVVSVGEELDLGGEPYADCVLFDTRGALKGGNGVSFNWDLLKVYEKPFILAGGIGLHNIKEALATEAWALDVNSKVEKEPGVKDLTKIKALLREMKR